MTKAQRQAEEYRQEQLQEGSKSANRRQAAADWFDTGMRTLGRRIANGLIEDGQVAAAGFMRDLMRHLEGALEPTELPRPPFNYSPYDK